jgi:hypothetical protein
MGGHMRRLVWLRNTPDSDWPADAEVALLAALRDGSATVEERGLAVALASSATFVTADLVDALVGVLRDAGVSDGTRADAALALGPVLAHCDDELAITGRADPLDADGIERVQAVLRRVFEDRQAPATVRRAVLEASVRAPRDWHADAIRQTWGTAGAEWRETALFAMGFTTGFEREMREGLRSSDPGILAEAVRAAGSRQLPDARPLIERILSDDGGDRELLLAAIQALGELGDGDLAELLVPFADDPDEEISAAVSYAQALLEDDDLYGDEEE